MVNYNNSKVYKIVSDLGDLVYIGSTTKNYLSSRLAEHRSAYKTRNNGIKKGKFSSYQLFNEYGPENCNIYLLELVICDSKNELLARERYHIERIECINRKHLNVVVDVDPDPQSSNNTINQILA